MDPGTRPPDITVRVLGPLDVRRGEDLVAVSSAMQRRVLAALSIAASAGSRTEATTVSLDALVRDLWGAEPPPSARNSLQSHVARLRGSLEVVEAVVTRPDGYALDPDVVVVDARLFADQVAAARRCFQHDPAAAGAHLRRALGLWRGEAYAEFAGGFAREESVRLSELRAQASELLCGAQARMGDIDGAIDTGYALVARHPLRGSAAAVLARTLAGGGRLPDALTVLRDHRQRLAVELGLDPDPRLEALERELLRGGPVDPATGGAPPAAAVPVPVPPSPPRVAGPTLGRDHDRHRVEQALGRSRLVTVVGPGGVGKTRLAAVVAEGSAPSAWIDLAAVDTAEDVAPAVLDALGIPAPRDPGQAAADVIAAFAGLLVIDNCEHVLTVVADLLDAALARRGAVRVLATSRERLDLPGEVVVPLGPLPVPAPDEASVRDPVVALFLARVAALGGGEVTPADAARVSALVDGLPLAVELAAVRAAALPTETLVQRLPRDLELLAGTDRRRGARHRTLTRVIDWSHALLDADEQVLFRRLSVFSATFPLRFAERICADGSLPSARIAGLLARLVESSMVARIDEDRYRLLGPLRVYAADRLAASPDLEPVMTCQRDAVLALAARADRELSGPGERGVLSDLASALPDIRAVHARAVEAGDLDTVARLAGGLARFGSLQGRPHLLRWGAAVSGDTPAHRRGGADGAGGIDAEVRGRALAAAAAGAWLVGDLDAAAALADEADGLCLTPWSRIAVEEVLGDVLATAGDLMSAAAAYDRMRAAARDVGHPGLLAHAELGLALVHLYRDELPEALALAESSVERGARSGAPSVEAFAQYALGEVLSLTDPESALGALDRARTLAAESGIRFVEGLARTADVALRGRHGDPVEALRRYLGALALWRDTRADGLVQTALRNLVILLARIGADEDALTVALAVERLATKPSFGAEARDVASALAAVHDRVTPDVRARAEAAAHDVLDLRTAADLGLDRIGAALGRVASVRAGAR